MNTTPASEPMKGQKKREYMRAWRRANAEKVRIAAKIRLKAWRKENPEKRNAWAKANPEKIKAYQKEYDHNRYLANPSKRKASLLAWTEKNRDRLREAKRIWNIENADKVRGYSSKRRARKRNTSTIQNVLVNEVYKRDGWRCQICKKRVNQKLSYPNPLSSSIDHIVPLSKGGAHSYGNVQLTHLKCNVAVGVGGVKQTRLF